MKSSVEQINIENNQRLIIFLENRLSDLPDGMRESWSQVREILVKSPDVSEDGDTVWQGSLLKLIREQKNYEALKSWQLLLLNIANTDPKYWNWEEYWTYCKENKRSHWDKHATCYYKIAHLEKEREKVADLLLGMFNDRIEETAKMGSYGIQSILEIMKNVPLISQEYLKRLEEERLEEFLEWRTNNNINEFIRWGNEEKISVIIVKKIIEREKEKLETELIELRRKKNQGYSEFEEVSESTITEMETKKADLVSQIEKEKAELNQLTEPVKSKLSEEMQDIFEELYKIQTEIIRRGNDFVKGKLEGMKWILNKKVSAEELQNILDKQEKLIQLEEELATLEKKLNKLNSSRIQTEVQASEQKEKDIVQSGEEKSTQQPGQESSSEQEKQKLIEIFSDELKKYTNEEITAQVVQRAEQQTKHWSQDKK